MLAYLSGLLRVTDLVIEMLVLEGDDRTDAIDLKLATLLAAVAGALNAAGFQATGFFSANMTGNVSALSDQIGLGRFGPAAIFLVLLGAFIFGASCSGLLIEGGRRRGILAIYAYGVLLEAGLLLVLGALTLMMPDQRTLLTIGLSFIMGIQNAATTRISNARVRTTHVSGTATDIGLGIAAMMNGRTAPRLKTSMYTLFAFLLGGVFGVLVYLTIGGWLLIGTSALVAAIALPELRRISRSSTA